MVLMVPGHGDSPCLVHLTCQEANLCPGYRPEVGVSNAYVLLCPDVPGFVCLAFQLCVSSHMVWWRVVSQLCWDRTFPTFNLSGCEISVLLAWRYWSKKGNCILISNKYQLSKERRHLWLAKLNQSLEGKSYITVCSAHFSSGRWNILLFT